MVVALVKHSCAGLNGFGFSHERGGVDGAKLDGIGFETTKQDTVQLQQDVAKPLNLLLCMQDDFGVAEAR